MRVKNPTHSHALWMEYFIFKFNIFDPQCESGVPVHLTFSSGSPNNFENNSKLFEMTYTGLYSIIYC